MAPLAHAPALRVLDVMFVDSSEASEGLLDTRLVRDLAACSKLTELEVRGATVAD